MTEEFLHQVLKQLASLGPRPSEQVLKGLALASEQTYEQVLEKYNSLERETSAAPKIAQGALPPISG